MAAKAERGQREHGSIGFEDMLPGRTAYVSNCYGTKKHRNENNLLIKYRDALLVIEVKTGCFTDAPSVSDFNSHISHYKELIQKSNSQRAQMKDYIRKSDTELVLYDEHIFILVDI